jgi:hypothetical protein
MFGIFDDVGLSLEGETQALDRGRQEADKDANLSH